MTGKQVVYLDACIFIAWLKSEFLSPEDEDGITEIFRKLEAKEVILMTSTITLIEVLSQSFKSEKDELIFATALQHPNFRLESVTPDIARIAKDMREQKPRSGGKGFATPDAIHLATAIARKANLLYTTDKGKTGKTLGLLSAVDEGIDLPVTICRPLPPQRLTLFSASTSRAS